MNGQKISNRLNREKKQGVENGNKKNGSGLIEHLTLGLQGTWVPL